MLEKSSFRIIFGDAPVIKVFDFLLDHQEFDYSLTDVAKGAEIAWSTLHELWPDLVKIGIVKKTRQIGRAELYKLDAENPLAQKIIELDLFVSKQLVLQEAERQKVLA